MSRTSDILGCHHRHSAADSFAQLRKTSCIGTREGDYSPPGAGQLCRSLASATASHNSLPLVCKPPSVDSAGLMLVIAIHQL